MRKCFCDIVGNLLDLCPGVVKLSLEVEFGERIAGTERDRNSTGRPTDLTNWDPLGLSGIEPPKKPNQPKSIHCLDQPYTIILVYLCSRCSA